MPISIKDTSGNTVAMTNAQRVQLLSDLGAADASAVNTALAGKQNLAPTIVALNADRALTSADHRVNLAMTASRSVTVGAGGIEPHFINSTGGPLSLTITGTSGVIINGTANGSVTRTIPARGVLTLRADDINSYDIQRVASVEYSAASADRGLTNSDLSVNLVLTANRAFSLPLGLVDGFATQFSNGGTSSVTVTITPAAGVTVNGASTAVIRTIAVGQTTALLPVGTNAYILPGA